MWVEILLFVALVAIFFILRDRKPAGMSPGPFEIPFLGQMPIFDEHAAEKLKNQYGSIVTTRTGNMRTVIIYDYAQGKEVMGRLEMTGRPDFFRTFSLDEQNMGGVIGSEGAQWQHDRRFVLRNLRNLGMGKSYLEDAINFEAQALVDDLKKYNEEPIKFPDSFRTAALNIIWQMVASKRYELRSQEVDKIYQMNKKFQSMPLYTLIPIFMPGVKKVLPQFVLEKYFGEKLFNDFLDEFRGLIDESLKEHEANQDMDDPKDLIDEYLKEMKEKEEEGNNDFYRRGALNQIIADLFNAGSDTVNNMLKWVSYLLARYPEVAKRMHKEIDNVLPRNRLVSLNDKPNLGYVEAFVNETLRFSSMIVMNVQRTATRDTTIQDYNIPKGTVVSVCNYSCHFDPKYWTEPLKFNPERFLGEDGKFQAPKSGFFAFGQGRRQCLGETLARMELFLFTAAIAQNFDIEAPEGVDLPYEPVNLMGLRVPDDTGLVYKTRKE